MGLTAGAIGPMRASGGLAPFSLFEVRTASGALYLWSERDLSNVSSLLTTPGSDVPARYLGYIVGQPSFELTGTVETDTGSVSIQNYSGNTVLRDTSVAFSKSEFTGALAYFRLWRGDSETAIFSFLGKVTEADIDDDSMKLSLEGFGDWSNIVAPAYDVDVTCGLFFGSPECASTSPTPCQNTYGTCTSHERFKGFIAQWDWQNQGASLVQIAQPTPGRSYNPARAF